MQYKTLHLTLEAGALAEMGMVKRGERRGMLD